MEKQSTDSYPVMGGKKMVLSGHNFLQDSKVIFVEKAPGMLFTRGHLWPGLQRWWEPLPVGGAGPTCAWSPGQGLRGVAQSRDSAWTVAASGCEFLCELTAVLLKGGGRC